MNCYEDLLKRELVSDCSHPDRVAGFLNNGAGVIYMGFDATGDSLHVGSLLGLVALRRLQASGNKVIVLKGGATTRIGDPSGKRSERPLLTPEEIQSNGDAIEAQMRRILNFEGHNPALLVDNYDWFKDLDLLTFLREVGKHFPVGQMLGKESVRSRLDGDGLSFTEFSYQLLQAFDFHYLANSMGCNMQLGGADQWGNMIAGLDLIRRIQGDSDACVLTLPLMTTASGSKMGKTASGAVWLDAERTSPYEHYQFWINCDDRDVERFLKGYTFMPVEEIEALCATDLRAARHHLAYSVTAMVHSREAADAAVATSRAAFADADPESASELPCCVLSQDQLTKGVTPVDLLVLAGLSPTRSAALRLIKEGGAYLDGKRLEDPKEYLRKLSPNMLLRAGKKRYARLVIQTEETR